MTVIDFIIGEVPRSVALYDANDIKKLTLSNTALLHATKMKGTTCENIQSLYKINSEISLANILQIAIVLALNLQTDIADAYYAISIPSAEEKRNMNAGVLTKMINKRIEKFIPNKDHAISLKKLVDKLNDKIISLLQLNEPSKSLKSAPAVIPVVPTNHPIAIATVIDLQEPITNSGSSVTTTATATTATATTATASIATTTLEQSAEQFILFEDVILMYYTTIPNGKQKFMELFEKVIKRL